MKHVTEKQTISARIRRLQYVADESTPRQPVVWVIPSRAPRQSGHHSRHFQPLDVPSNPAQFEGLLDTARPTGATYSIMLPMIFGYKSIWHE